MPFSAPIVVEVVDDRDWRLVHSVTYRGRDTAFVVPGEFLTDFASVPRVLQWLVPRTGRHGPAALVHDYLCRSGAVSRKDADGVFRRILRELGVGVVLRHLMYAAVRIGSREFDVRAYGVALLALPVIGPPALLAAVALGLYVVAEWAAEPFNRKEQP